MRYSEIDILLLMTEKGVFLYQINLNVTLTV